MPTGPLAGYRVIELAGIGPGPFCAMLLSDLGADVIRVDRVQAVVAADPNAPRDLMNRGRRNVAVDLKMAEGVEVVLQLVERADALIEGFRPGVTERLGIGPDVCLTRNPKLVYGRMTGWGQEGPYAQMAGHDINYIALAGALAHMGHAGDRPTPPMNLVGDFGGGAMFLAMGVLAGMLEAAKSGQGQVVDSAMIDGTALLMTMFHGMQQMGFLGPRGTNLLDSGAWFYDTYETADARYVSFGSIEPQFYTVLLQRTGLDQDPDLPRQHDRESWPAMRERLAAIVKGKTQAEWNEIFEGTDACYAPVLPMEEARQHPHLVERQTFLEVDGTWQAAPAPRFSRTPGAIQRPSPLPGEHTDEVLGEWLGLDADGVGSLRSAGAIA